MTVDVRVARSIPKDVEVVAVPVGSSGAVPRSVGLNRAALAANGFDGAPLQTLVLPSPDGPTTIAVGIGRPDELSPKVLRDAAAAAVRSAGKRATMATLLADLQGVEGVAAGQAVTEGALLAAYRFHGRKTEPATGGLKALTVVAGQVRSAAVQAGVGRGTATAAATALARDLANMPPGDLTATGIAARAVEVAATSGLEIEVFNRDQLMAMGCGGIVGVNAGSVEPPRMVRLTYTPPTSAGGKSTGGKSTGHLVLVGKGVMYDSGGISLKPSDASHGMMKMDMSGAAAVLGAMSALSALGGTATVTGYMMCTDNLPSGSAMKLGDVLSFRNGKTAEILNTDAEGRLVLADGLSLAVEAKPDAVVDIATLTGACIAALGQKMAGVFTNDDGFVAKVKVAAQDADEPVWQLPLERSYRKLLDSNVADMKNVGGPYGGAILAALFLSEFVGDVPWAHLDIAGPMNSDADSGWLSKGATAFGTRLLIELAANFTAG